MLQAHTRLHVHVHGTRNVVAHTQSPGRGRVEKRANKGKAQISSSSPLPPPPPVLRSPYLVASCGETLQRHARTSTSKNSSRGPSGPSASKDPSSPCGSTSANGRAQLTPIATSRILPLESPPAINNSGFRSSAVTLGWDL